MDGTFSTTLKKVNGKLIHLRTGDEVLQKRFIEALKEGVQVDIYMEASAADGSLGQLAKVHKCIRIIASHTGNNVDEIKLVIKQKAGLLIRRTVMNQEYIDWKSFGNCDKDDLNLAIQACIDLGDTMGLNLR